MKAIRQRVQGRLLQANGRSALLLTHPKPAPDAANLLYLRYALVTMGREDHIFPSFLMDDWGSEVRGLKLYRWVRENGDDFPRAEIFGFEADGQETQLFLRELELYHKLPCYLYPTQETLLTQGTLLDAILLPDASVSEPVQVKRPSSEMVKRPLRTAQVSWWLVPPDTTTFDFALAQRERGLLSPPPSGEG